MPFSSHREMLCSKDRQRNGEKRLARAMTFSIPRAWEKSFLTASSAISKSTMAAAQVEIAVRERSKKEKCGQASGNGWVHLHPCQT